MQISKVIDLIFLFELDVQEVDHLIADEIIVVETIDAGQEAQEETEDQDLDLQETVVVKMTVVVDGTVETDGMIEEMVTVIVITEETDVTLLTKNATKAVALFVILSKIHITIRKNQVSRIKSN